VLHGRVAGEPGEHHAATKVPDEHDLRADPARYAAHSGDVCLQVARFGCLGAAARKIDHLDRVAICFQGGSRFRPDPAAAESPVDIDERRHRRLRGD
jgi:hypothetical protein